MALGRHVHVPDRKTVYQRSVPVHFGEGGRRGDGPRGNTNANEPWVINYDPTRSGEFVDRGKKVIYLNRSMAIGYAANQLVNPTKTTSGGLDLYVVNRLEVYAMGLMVSWADGVHATADDRVRCW